MNTIRASISQEKVLKDAITSAINRIQRKKQTSNDVINTIIKLIKEGIEKNNWTWENFGITEAELIRIKRRMH